MTFQSPLWLLALLAVVAGAALAGCERKGADAFVVGFSQMESDNPWRNAETQSLRDEAQKRGIELVVTDAQGQTAKQVADVEDLIARRVSVILLAPREFEGHLGAAGLRDDHIRRLTRLFEAARYGGRGSSERDRREAIDCLAAIVRDHGRTA